MPDLLPEIVPALNDAWVRQALDFALRGFLAFVWVATRLSGLVVIGPVFGHPDVPMQVRVLLVVALSLVITPAVTTWSPARTFRHLDQNGDAQLDPGEIPWTFAAEAAACRARAGVAVDAPLTLEAFRVALPVPRTPIELACMLTCEFGVGLALGLGVLTTLSALQMAGQIIDQQTGVSLGEIFNPELDATGSMTGQLLHLVGTCIFLLAGGHVLATSAVTQTFFAIPPGFGVVSQPVIELLSELIQQSLRLAVQVSAPVLVVMSLAGMAMGFLGHTIPQINVLVIGFPIRTIVGLFLFALLLAGAAELMSAELPVTISRLQELLGG